MTDQDGLVRKVLVKPIRRDDKSTTTQERERAIHDLVFLNDTSVQPEEVVGEDAIPTTTLSCRKINTCPFCDQELTSGGLNSCYHFHRSLTPSEYYKELKRKGLGAPLLGKLNESDDEAYDRLNRLIRPHQSTLDDRNTNLKIEELTVPTALRSGVTFL